SEMIARTALAVPPQTALFPELVGHGPAMSALFADMARLTDSDVAVHIFGETGTGKERVAVAIHRRSRRGGGPFVAEHLGLEELVGEGGGVDGHVRGAFTGAVSAREGYVAR